MKKRILYFFLPLLVVISMVTNSCKKESKTDLVSSLLTHGAWQLASVMVFNYVGAGVLPTDTLNTNCSLKQVFTFNSNNTCNYTNFACISQTKQGNWALSSDDLYLMSNMSCTDTVKGSNGTATLTDMPFNNAQIVNLGQYSLVIQTGDVSTYYTATTKRVIVQYGFVHPATN
jgi:hypothetical protein